MATYNLNWNISRPFRWQWPRRSVTTQPPRTRIIHNLDRTSYIHRVHGTQEFDQAHLARGAATSNAAHNRWLRKDKRVVRPQIEIHTTTTPDTKWRRFIRALGHRPDHIEGRICIHGPTRWTINPHEQDSTDLVPSTTRSTAVCTRERTQTVARLCIIRRPICITHQHIWLRTKDRPYTH